MARPSSRPRVRAAHQGLIRLVREAEGAAAFLDLVTDGSSDAVFVVDPDRNVLLFSRRAEELTGFRRDEALGRDCLATFRCARCLEACRVFERGRIGAATVEIFRKDETTLRVRKRAAVIRDRLGRTVGAVETFRVLDAKADHDGSLACGADGPWGGAEALMASLGRALAVVDREFTLQRVSRNLAELAGRTAEELQGSPAATVLGGGLFEPDAPFRRALLDGQRREGWRGSLARPAAPPLRVSVTGAPMPSEGPCDPGLDAAAFVLVVRPEPAAGAADAQQPAVFEGMVGRSAGMRRVFDLLEHLRDSDATVLITGESGTGKELVARAIHARSRRAGKPFVAVNCGALPGNLLESELFGHVRGAFTGASWDKPGRFEVVEDGTLFLDEIGDLPLELQVKLLRVLQERQFERVGQVRPQPFRARVVAATHHDLARAAAQKTFREDLFYRLNVVPVRLPPLRERREDVELLVGHVLDRIGERRSRLLRLSPGAMRALLACEWPGNVRQLENALEYATAVCDGQTIHVEDLPPEVAGAAPAPAPRGAPPAGAPAAAFPPPADPGDAGPAAATRIYPRAEDVIAALRGARGRRSAAAAALGVSRTTLWRLMREFGLE
jgi:PAS domain S-box-containing protein